MTTTWTWQWRGWASWRVSPAALVVAALAVALDLATAWLGKPEWYFGRVLVSPALPLAVVLVVLVGGGGIGMSRAGVAAWREFLAGAGVGIVVASLVYAHTVSGWREVEGVLLTAGGEEVVYRLGAVLLIGAACARLCGRDWRDTSRWGTGPAVSALVGASLLFTALPGHVAQMSGVGGLVPFISLSMLLGYVALRSGSLLPVIAVHALLDLSALAYLAGTSNAASRFVIAGTLLTALTVALMPAGRRLGLRSRMPAVIDLREPTDVPLPEPGGARAGRGLPVG